MGRLNNNNRGVDIELINDKEQTPTATTTHPLAKPGTKTLICKILSSLGGITRYARKRKRKTPWRGIAGDFLSPPLHQKKGKGDAMPRHSKS